MQNVVLILGRVQCITATLLHDLFDRLHDPECEMGCNNFFQNSSAFLKTLNLSQNLNRPTRNDKQQTII